MAKASLIKRAKNIRLLAMDVDGVLTAGDIIVLESGEEVKLWNAKDRLILASLRNMPGLLTLAWITGRSSKNVSWSAKDLGVRFVAQGIHDKKAELAKILKQNKLSFEQAAYIGDDLIDLGVLGAVGFSACPSDAVSDVRKRVHYVSPIGGGRGAVRDVIEYILKAQKKWDAVVARYLS